MSRRTFARRVAHHKMEREGISRPNHERILFNGIRTKSFFCAALAEIREQTHSPAPLPRNAGKLEEILTVWR